MFYDRLRRLCSAHYTICQAGHLLVPVILLAFAFVASDAAADHKKKHRPGWKDERAYERQYEYEREYRGRPHRYKVGQKRDRRKGKYKYEYTEDDCVYKYEEKHGRIKEEYKCRGGRNHKRNVRHGHRHLPWRPAPAIESGVVFRPFDLSASRRDRAASGSVPGAATGGLVGSRFGKRDGRLAATAAGTFIGMMVGGSIGRHMDSLDHACAGHVFEHVPDGETIVWRGADNVPTGSSRSERKALKTGATAANTPPPRRSAAVCGKPMAPPAVSPLEAGN